MEIHGLSALTTNYIWIITTNETTVVVDPGEARPVIEYLNATQRSCDAILITHHHLDHTGGVTNLLQTYPKCPVYGPNLQTLGIDNVEIDPLKLLHIPKLSSTIKIMRTPGHTLDHLCYLIENKLFCGDTLFSAGCGRLFEGDGKDLYNSLEAIRQLPDSTIIYPAHEYTEDNIRFALTIEPDNTPLIEYEEQVKKKRAQDIPSLPTTLAREKSINPFLRTHVESIQTKVSQLSHQPVASAMDTLITLRQLKDQFI